MAMNSRVPAVATTQQQHNSPSSPFATMTDAQTYTTIELLTPNGPEFRRVSTAPARPPRDEEIPLIDLGGIDGGLEAKTGIAEYVREAAENTGFFYIQNHGINESLIDEALRHAKAFFAQAPERKELLSPEYTGLGIGYRGVSSTQINRTESRGVFLITYVQARGDHD